jgi:predicted transcriptional regulator
MKKKRKTEINLYSEEARLNESRASSFVRNSQQNIATLFGKALKDKRRKLGITQMQLSQISGLSRSYISEIECGKQSISLERADRLAQAVNSKLVELLVSKQEG